MLMYEASHLKLTLFARGPRPAVRGRVWFRGLGQLVFGGRVVLDGRECPIELYVKAGGRLDIGEEVVIASGASIETTCSVRVGRGSRIGEYCKILDNHWHSLRERDKRPEPVPITVGENVILQDHVILLPGTRIGDNVSILARSVVSRTIPPNVVVAGYPPRVVGRRPPP